MNASMESPQASVPEPSQVASLKPAGLGQRLAAFVIDAVLANVMIMLPVGVLSRTLIATGLWPIGEIDMMGTYEGMEASARGAMIVAYFISGGPFYYILCESSAWQATLGKRWMRICVADDQQKRINIARSAGRWVSKWVCGLTLLTLVSVVTVASTERRKAVHDYMAKTLVLEGRPDAKLDQWRIGVFIGVPVAWVLLTLIVVL